MLNAANSILPVSLATLHANYFVDYSNVLAGVLAGVLTATHPPIALFVLAKRNGGRSRA